MNQEEYPSTESSNVEIVNPELQPNTEDVMLELQNKMKAIKEAKAQIKDMLSWGDIVIEDRRIIEKLQATIDSEKVLAEKIINDQFDLLEKELIPLKEIKSESGNVYSTDKILKIITQLRLAASKGISPDLDAITRTNNLRPRVKLLINMILELKKKE
jgi:hypothetical protein